MVESLFRMAVRRPRRRRRDTHFCRPADGDLRPAAKLAALRAAAGRLHTPDRDPPESGAEARTASASPAGAGPFSDGRLAEHGLRPARQPDGTYPDGAVGDEQLAYRPRSPARAALSLR